MWKGEVQYPHDLIRYWPPINVVCVSSHFWPFTKVNLVLVNFNKKMRLGQTDGHLIMFNSAGGDGSEGGTSLVKADLQISWRIMMCLPHHQMSNYQIPHHQMSNYFLTTKCPTASFFISVIITTGAIRSIDRQNWIYQKHRHHHISDYSELKLLNIHHVFLQSLSWSCDRHYLVGWSLSTLHRWLSVLSVCIFVQFLPHWVIWQRR